MLAEPTQRHPFVVVPDDELESPFGAIGETRSIFGHLGCLLGRRGQ